MLLVVLYCRVDIGITDCTNCTGEVSDFKLVNYDITGGSVTDRNLVRLIEILESGILPWQKNSVYL